jgi:hypothetical protein
MNDKIILGNKNTEINGWKLFQYVDYPSYNKPCLIYNLAYWKNGRIIEETEEFFNSKIIAIDFYNEQQKDK